MASATYVARRRARDGDERERTNEAMAHARRAMRRESAIVDGGLARDFQHVIAGDAIYLPYFHCDLRDYGVLCALAREMEVEAMHASGNSGMVNWSKHLKSENPEFSATFHKIVNDMATYFDVEVYATRMNFYRDGTDWKPFHHDSHAYGGRAQREDFTMGASFGGTRELVFLHEPSGQTFSFPQNNGDVFAFTSEVNKRFKHGVPKASKSGQSDPRFSIIAWGRRRSVNSRNGGGEVTGTRDGGVASDENTEHTKGHASASHASVNFSSESRNELVMGTGEVSAIIRKFIDRHTAEDAQAMSVRERNNARDHKAVASTSKENEAVTPMGETSAALARDLMFELGEGAYLKLRTCGRQFQEGILSVDSFYEQAIRLCDGDVSILLRLVAYLPDLERRSQLLSYLEARRQ